jgi:hypothetical protein
VRWHIGLEQLLSAVLDKTQEHLIPHHIFFQSGVKLATAARKGHGVEED